MQTTVRFWLHRLEDGALIALLLGMLTLACAQILLRNILGFTLAWVEPLTQVGLLWLALIGAMVGTRRGSHIRIDLADKLLTGRKREITGRAVGIVCAVALGWLSWHTGRLVIDEFVWGRSRVAGVREWVFQLVMPFAFGVMALRSLARAVLPNALLPTDEKKEANAEGAG